MPIIILVLTISIILGLLLRRWFRKASKEDKHHLVMLSVWTFSGVGLLVLILTGRFFHALGWGLMILIALLISGASARRQRTQTYQKLGSPMTKKQAYEVLGLKSGASDEEIHDAYIELIQKNHPDHGGSDYLSAQINEAHDVLMDPKCKDNEIN